MQYLWGLPWSKPLKAYDQSEMTGVSGTGWYPRLAMIRAWFMIKIFGPFNLNQNIQSQLVSWLETIPCILIFRESWNRRDKYQHLEMIWAGSSDGYILQVSLQNLKWWTVVKILKANYYSQFNVAPPYVAKGWKTQHKLFREVFGKIMRLNHGKKGLSLCWGPFWIILQNTSGGMVNSLSCLCLMGWRMGY